jgi:SAM-dependent methyltransferase
VRTADAERLPFDDGEFDIVYSWGVLHHTPNMQAALDEAVRVLAPGGQLKVMLYHRYSWVATGAWARFCLLRGRPFQGLRAAVAQVESPGTQAVTPKEIKRRLGRLDALDARPLLTRWDRRVAPGIARLTGNRFGWFLLITARKPATTNW